MIDSLLCLDAELKSVGSGLLLLEGKPNEVLERVLDDSVELIVWEKDTEPYAKARDAEVKQLAEKKGIDVLQVSGHTLFDFDDLKSKSVPTTLSAFQKLVQNKDVSRPLDAPKKMPKLPTDSWVGESQSKNPPKSWEKKYKLPLSEGQVCLIPGGEKIALEKMRAYCNNAQRVNSFEKPKTNPTAQWYSADEKKISNGATTVLSPYLHFGTLSCRLFYWTLVDIEKKSKNHTTPPVSLVGQLLWREFFHYVGCYSPNFDKIEGNPICRQIQWDSDDALVEKWKNAETGFPWIDAVMTQLRTEGWIHHLARHCVACFLTRGDLYQSWEKGTKVFEELLVDADWSLNK